ncbi:MAG: hypothetical protein ACPGVT_08590 [Maricaulaceae bacterium]
MKDIFFYPLAALIIGGMVYFALSFGADDGPANADLYELSGDSLTALFPSPGTTMQLASDGQNGGSYAVASSHMTRAEAPPSAGVFGTLGPAYEKNFGGQEIRITVRARYGRSNPALKFETAYFSSGAGDSEWQNYALTEKFADYSFLFTPGKPQGKKGNDYIGIWPDPTGQQGSIDIMSVRVERVAPQL